jgi:hypothetical protein
MFCLQCGKEIQDGVKFCENCGWAIPAATVQNVQPAATPTVVPNSQSVPAGKSHIVFFVLSIFWIVIGMVYNIAGLYYWQQWRSLSLGPGAAFAEYFSSFLGYSTIFMTTGILFSVISLFKKPDKKYLWLSISACFLLVAWNYLALMILPNN